MIQVQQKTIGEIAAANPETVKVLQKYGIDFCCGGKRLLDEVCAEKGISLEAIQADLDKAISPDAEADRNWAQAPIGELIDHILDTHHAFLNEELPRLEGILERVVKNHSARHGDSVIPLQAEFLALKAELDMHLRKEETILFPYIKQAQESITTGVPLPHSCFGSVENPIRMMEFEHDNAGGALRRMRAITEDYTLPGDACNGYRALFHGLTALESDLHMHIHKENNVLFPRARKL